MSASQNNREPVDSRDGSSVVLIEELFRGPLGARWSATWTDANGSERPATVWALTLAALGPDEAGQVLAASTSGVGARLPSVPEVLDVIRVDDELWQVSEHVEGVFLASLLSEAVRSLQALPLGAVLRIACELARAAAGVRHAIAPLRPARLLWPEACLISDSGKPLLMDAALLDAHARCSAP